MSLNDAGIFGFETARKLLAQDVEPDIISSDLHAFSVDGPAFDLPTTMSKLLNLGMPLDHIVQAVTYNPAKAIGYENDLGSLEIGSTGDITVLDLIDGEFLFQDCFNKEMSAQKRLVPAFIVKDGKTMA